VAERLIMLANIGLIQLFFALSVEALDLILVTLLFHLTFERRVKVVFDMIIGSSLQVFSDLGPSVTVLDV
jgi:hypothetical protein